MNSLARYSLLVVTAIVAWTSLAVSAAIADELPGNIGAIKSLTSEQARKVVAQIKWGELNLDGLTTLDAATARALVKFRGHVLKLNGLTTLDAATAAALAEFKHPTLSPSLCLNGLTTLDPATAKALADFWGDLLALSGIASLDAETAASLAEFKGERLSLIGLTTLDAETAKALARVRGRYLLLDGLTTLNADIAKPLAEFNGSLLSLGGLTTLDADTAEALAAFKGHDLHLNGLTTLDHGTVKVLAEFDGELFLPDRVQKAFFARYPLTPDTALEWAALVRGDLSQITAFESPDSVKIAAALATRKGRLSLRNLKKISPKTLTALIQKEDVEIPQLETLELIQEPDGSPTEDFVIPEGFQERQKARQQGR